MDLYGMIIGAIVGDALGVPYEFQSRENVTKKIKETGLKMIDGGYHDVPKGTWSDDTSMTLATMQSIVNNNMSIVLSDIMEEFLKWIYDSKYTASGKVFDYGRTTIDAIRKYEKIPTSIPVADSDYNSCGNGGLMRIHPLAYCFSNDFKNEHEEYFEVKYEVIKRVTQLTHSHPICIICSCFLVELLIRSQYASKREAISEVNELMKKYIKYFDENDRYVIKYVQDLTYDNLINLEYEKLSGSGFVLETLTSAVWCFLNSDSYNEAVKLAIELGEDTDTIASITGALSGARYCMIGINEEWIENTVNLQYVMDLTSSFEEIMRMEKVGAFYGEDFKIAK